MVSDTEPRYRLVDSNGNVVGSLYAEADGTLKLQEGTSGSDNEVSVATDGTFTAPAVSTDEAFIGNLETFREDSSAVYESRQKTEGVTEVAQSSTTIYTGLYSGSALVFVEGHLQGDSFTFFGDLVLFSRGGNHTRLGETGESSPANRSYDSGGQDKVLRLSMASGTYDVLAHAVDISMNY